MSIVRLLLFLVLAAAPVGEASGDGGGAGSAVARTILALYDGDDEPEPRNSRMLRFAALPLNHLGLVLRFHDLRHGLPSAEALEDVRGVLTWFDNDLMPDAEGYAAWATDQLRRGMRFVVLGDPGVATASRPAASEFFRFFGLRAPLRHRLVTYDLAVVHQDPELYGYERPLTPPFKPFPVYHPTGEPGYTVHLAVGSSDGATMPLAISGPHGVLVAAGYSHFLTETSGQRKWYVDPFALFSRAFATGGLP